MDDAAQDYIDAIAAEFRPLFDRLHRLILDEHPDAAITLSYQMPTYTVGRRRLYLGVWKHGMSLYGWRSDVDTGFTSRHPGLMTGKGTLRLRPAEAAGIPDEDLRELVRAALNA